MLQEARYSSVTYACNFILRKRVSNSGFGFVRMFSLWVILHINAVNALQVVWFLRTHHLHLHINSVYDPGCVVFMHTSLKFTY
jgi:hypothetical protein